MRNKSDLDTLSMDDLYNNLKVYEAEIKEQVFTSVSELDEPEDEKAIRAKSVDHLGKFEGKADEGFLVGYSVNRRGPEWLFDIDSLPKSMNYEPVTTGNQTNDAAGIEINVNAGQAGQEKAFDHEYILLPFMPSHSPLSLGIQSSNDKDADEAPGKGDEGIKREFSVARTPQQTKVAERKNRTLIEAAKTMLADSLLPTTFRVKAVNTACYVQNRVLVTKPHNKTPYKLLICRSPNLDFMRPFGCSVTILNTLDHLGKFEGKADEGFLVGYSVNSKAFRVVNSRTRKVKENLHIRF
nr:retrovirus-related Pol polyprotein from transposon TNT 1-94 [Tanacetum cinerariifolium]